jgi:hypothetical protein
MSKKQPEFENWVAPEICDGCGSDSEDVQLFDDSGIPVCMACIETVNIGYARGHPIVSHDNIIRFEVDYSLQKGFLRDHNTIPRVFQELGLIASTIDYGAGVYTIAVKISKEDAVIIKLKNLEQTIRRRIADAAVV